MKHSGHRVSTSSQSRAGSPKGPDYDWLVETGFIVRQLMPGHDCLAGFLSLSCSFSLSHTHPPALLYSLQLKRGEDETVMLKVKNGAMV